jgi:hypothetical protein
MQVIDTTTAIVAGRPGYEVWAKFSSVPIYKGFQKFPQLWQLQSVQRDTPKSGEQWSAKAASGTCQNIFVSLGGADNSRLILANCSGQRG